MTITVPPRNARLPSGPPGSRGGEVRRGLLSTLMLTTVVVGVPVALLIFVGNPLPSTAPGTDWLTADVTIDVVLNLLALVLWIAWVHFVVCVVIEWRAARRASGLPGQVPLGGGSQLLARRLVAGVLLLGGAATLAPSTTGLAEPPPISVTQDFVTAERTGGRTVTAGAPAIQEATVSPTTAAQKFYEVQPPEGRRHDCLWDIAERTLGDPLRYKEIFELNRDRVQPDGRSLADADLIHPGWIFTMPTDASGPGITVVEPVAPPSAVAGQPTPAGQDVRTAPGPTGPDESRLVPQPGTPAPPAEEGDQNNDRALLGGGLLMAGLLVALSARRGPYGDPDAMEQRMRLAADDETAGLLDRALRILAAARAGQGLPLPEVALAYASREQLVLHLTGAAGAPALSEPPHPWQAEESGRSWTVRADDLPPGPAPNVAAPYPALVNIASQHGFELLVDLELAPGLVALGGDARVARDVAVSLAVELATNTWSDGVTVTLVGFGEELADAAPDHLRQVATLSAVLADVEDDSGRVDDLARALGVEGVLAGRLSRAPERWRPHVLVLSGPPTPEESVRLQHLVGRGRTPLAVVCVGDAPSARWRFVVDGSGSVDLGLLGVRGQARALPPEEYREIATLARRFDETRAQRSLEVAAMTPLAAMIEHSAAVVSLPTGVPAVQIQLLGPVDVVAPGPVEEPRRALLTEVVVAAALHRNGLHDAVLRSTVWPRGVSDDVVADVIRDVNRWLGGSRFFQADDGRWCLDDDVHTDWDVFRALVSDGTGVGEADRLLRALDLARGEAFSAVPAGRYRWLAFHRAARDARVLATTVARRAAEILDGDPKRAGAALHAGLKLAPTAEVLWRDMLRLVASRDPSSLAVTIAALDDALDRNGIRRAEPETDALIEQLAPQMNRDAGRTA